MVVYGGTWIYIFGESLGFTVVFKCSRVTGGVWGNMDIYFWGILKHKAAVLSSHLQTFEYNHQLQEVPNNIYPFSPIHHLLPSNT
jgi:hypothetical protein